MPDPSPLDFLKSHFDALKPRAVEIEGFPFVFVFDPLNAEQAFKYVAAAKSPSAAVQARGFAELIVETVKLESGEPAFPLVKGGMNPVEVLTKRTPHALFARLVENLAIDTPTDEAEDIAKK